MIVNDYLLMIVLTIIINWLSSLMILYMIVYLMIVNDVNDYLL